MEDARGHATGHRHTLLKLQIQAEGRSGVPIRLPRCPCPPSWHRSSTTSSLDDAGSTSCSLPSACASASAALSCSSLQDLQSLLSTLGVAAAAATGAGNMAGSGASDDKARLARARLLLASSGTSRRCLAEVQVPFRRTITSFGTSSVSGETAAMAASAAGAGPHVSRTPTTTSDETLSLMLPLVEPASSPSAVPPDDSLTRRRGSAIGAIPVPSLAGCQPLRPGGHGPGPGPHLGRRRQAPVGSSGTGPGTGPGEPALRPPPDVGSAAAPRASAARQPPAAAADPLTMMMWWGGPQLVCRNERYSGGAVLDESGSVLGSGSGAGSGVRVLSPAAGAAQTSCAAAPFPAAAAAAAAVLEKAAGRSSAPAGPVAASSTRGIGAGGKVVAVGSQIAPSSRLWAAVPSDAAAVAVPRGLQQRPAPIVIPVTYDTACVREMMVNPLAEGWIAPATVATAAAVASNAAAAAAIAAAAAADAGCTAVQPPHNLRARYNGQHGPSGGSPPTVSSALAADVLHKYPNQRPNYACLAQCQEDLAYLDPYATLSPASSISPSVQYLSTACTAGTGEELPSNAGLRGNAGDAAGGLHVADGAPPAAGLCGNRHEISPGLGLQPGRQVEPEIEPFVDLQPQPQQPHHQALHHQQTAPRGSPPDMNPTSPQHHHHHHHHRVSSPAALTSSSAAAAACADDGSAAVAALSAVMARGVAAVRRRPVPRSVSQLEKRAGPTAGFQRSATGALDAGISRAPKLFSRGAVPQGLLHIRSSPSSPPCCSPAMSRGSAPPSPSPASSIGGGTSPVGIQPYGYINGHSDSSKLRLLAAKAAGKAAAVAAATAAAAAAAAAAGPAASKPLALQPPSGGAAGASLGSGSGGGSIFKLQSQSQLQGPIPTFQPDKTHRARTLQEPELTHPSRSRSSLTVAATSTSTSAAVAASSQPATGATAGSQRAAESQSQSQALRLISCTLRASEVKRSPGSRAGKVLTPEELSRRLLAEAGGGATRLLLTRAAAGTADLPPPATRSPLGAFPPIAEDEAGPQEGPGSGSAALAGVGAEAEAGAGAGLEEAVGAGGSGGSGCERDLARAVPLCGCAVM